MEMINRKEFIYKIVRWCLFTLLAAISVLLGNKIVKSKDCFSCPEYSSCLGVDDCKVESETNK